MIRSLSTAGSGMIAQQFNLDVIANNLANVNTTGFKQQRAEFEDLMYQGFKAAGASLGNGVSQPEAQQIGLGVKYAGNATSFGPGPAQQTGNPLNMVINGEGFFQVTKGGDTVYTRDGSFRTDSTGLVVTTDGYPLVPQITLPQGYQQLAISSSGVVTAVLPGGNDAQELGNVQLAVFGNPAGLSRIGNNLYAASGGSGQAQVLAPGTDHAGEIQSGFLEGSNVQIVEEMVRMILAQRAYEINSKAIQTADDMLGVLNSLKR